eukprot:SAG22_NODE_170_length_16713_cov_33.746298_11_plen_94_part_00
MLFTVVPLIVGLMPAAAAEDELEELPESRETLMRVVELERRQAVMFRLVRQLLATATLSANANNASLASSSAVLDGCRADSFADELCPTNYTL